jgi:threonyl-tRNA synthetase
VIDHRMLGRELGLFDSDPLIGAGLPYWLPAGAAVRHALEEYVRGVEQRAGYRHVHSPVLGKRQLYELSGHWAHYRDDMFPPMDVGGEQLVLRPSLCPHHALIYRSRGRSHRELPLRIAELGGMYRAELSGVLGGLSRTRAIQLNDAHIFCAAGDVGAEVAAALGMIGDAYAAMGLAPARYRLSLPGAGDKHLGGGRRRAAAAPPGSAGPVAVPGADMWARAGAVLVDVLDGAGIGYERGDGEAAFYGPKIDVQVADAAGRESTLSTVQVDFFQPERFDLRYVAAGGAGERPVIVHRSVVGSLERAVAHLIEAHGGAFPPWLDSRGDECGHVLLVVTAVHPQVPGGGRAADERVHRRQRRVVQRQRRAPRPPAQPHPPRPAPQGSPAERRGRFRTGIVRNGA